VADLAVATVEALGVDAIELAHGSRKIGLPRLEQEVVVVVHQAVGVHNQVEARDDLIHRAGELDPKGSAMGGHPIGSIAFPAVADDVQRPSRRRMRRMGDSNRGWPIMTPIRSL